MTKWAKTTQPCPCKRSSDAYAIDENGVGFCFSCSKLFTGDKEVDDKNVVSDLLKRTLFPHRGLNANTLSKYGIVTRLLDGQPVETAFVYPKGAVKLRSMTEKKFRSVGQMNNETLFGKNIFDKNSKQSITITEGEYDAASVYQMLNGKTAAVSVRSGSSAYKDVSAEYEYINSFEKIVLCFDNDDVGKQAAQSIAGLFDFEKVYRLELTKHKDANAYLQEGDTVAFVEAWQGCKRYTPDAILSTFDDFKKALVQTQATKLADYPVQQLQDKLGGMHEQEVIVFKGDEGIGKTEIFRLLEHHLLRNTNLSVGIIHLEESVSEAMQGLVSYHIKGAVNLNNGLMNDDEVFEAFKDIVGGKENRVFFHDSYDFDDENNFLDNVRFLVSVCGCKVVLFDHISWLATGGDNEDERKKLDRISQRLKILAKELKFCLIEISHVNDDGKTRGSRNITKVANTVVDMSRDVKNPIASERNKLYLVIEKARMRGAETGPAGFVEWNPATHNLEDM